MIERVYDDRKDEVRAGRVLVHGRASCFTLPDPKVVDLFSLLERCQLALLHIIDVYHAGIWILTQLKPRFVGLVRLGRVEKIVQLV